MDDTCARLLRVELGAEHAAVDGDVVLGRAERQPARPVQILGREQRRCTAELDHAPRIGGDTLVAQRARESDEPRDLIRH